MIGGIVFHLVEIVFHLALCSDCSSLHTLQLRSTKNGSREISSRILGALVIDSKHVLETFQPRTEVEVSCELHQRQMWVEIESGSSFPIASPCHCFSLSLSLSLSHTHTLSLYLSLSFVVSNKNHKKGWMWKLQKISPYILVFLLKVAEFIVEFTPKFFPSISSGAQANTLSSCQNHSNLLSV